MQSDQHPYSGLAYFVRIQSTSMQSHLQHTSSAAKTSTAKHENRKCKEVFCNIQGECAGMSQDTQACSQLVASACMQASINVYKRSACLVGFLKALLQLLIDSTGFCQLL